MTILVTGGAGYIGSHMVWKLIDCGERVLVADRLSTGFEWAVAPEAELRRGEIADDNFREGLFAKGDIEAVIHFAGSIIVPESIADPLGYYGNNTCVSRALIESAVRHGVKHFIFSSTAAVYGNVGLGPVSEDTMLLPESPYGRSKLMTETMLADTAAAFKLRYTALRYFNVSGADPKKRTGQSTKGATHLIKVASETALGKRHSMQIFGTDYDTPDGTCMRDFIHVSDLAEAHYLALLRLRAGGGSLVANCGYGKGYSVLQVIDSMKRMSGVDFKTENVGRRPGDAVTVVANADRARRELGWAPIHDDLDFIVRTALEWEDALTRRNSF